MNIKSKITKGLVNFVGDTKAGSLLKSGLAKQKQGQTYAGKIAAEKKAKMSLPNWKSKPMPAVKTVSKVKPMPAVKPMLKKKIGRSTSTGYMVR